MPKIGWHQIDECSLSPLFDFTFLIPSVQVIKNLQEMDGSPYNYFFAITEVSSKTSDSNSIGMNFFLRKFEGLNCIGLRGYGVNSLIQPFQKCCISRMVIGTITEQLVLNFEVKLNTKEHRSGTQYNEENLTKTFLKLKGYVKVVTNGTKPDVLEVIKNQQEKRLVLRSLYCFHHVPRGRRREIPNVRFQFNRDGLFSCNYFHVILK
jgi:hypothetical protein